MLNIMIKPVSSSCDLRCRYCFYADESDSREIPNYGKMSGETAETLIRRAFIDEDDCITFSFQGGEPTLAGVDFFADFVRTVERYNTRNLKIFYAIQTNGCSLDGKLCSFFRDHGFLCGVSIDGTGSLHDENRKDGEGRGTYRRAKEGLSLLRRYGVDVNILCVVTEEACRRADEIWNALSPYGHLQLIPCIPPFRQKDGADRLTPTPRAYGEFLCRVYDLYEAHLLSGHYVSERRMDNYLSVLMGKRPEMCGMCGVCGAYFLIEADGSVYPCDFYVLDEYRLGNIRDTSFARLRRTDTAQRFAREGGTLPRSCADCDNFSLCRGGCRRDREPFFDGIGTDNRFCESYRFFFQNRLPQMLRLSDKIKGVQP